MTPEEFAQLAFRHGGIAGSTEVDTIIKTNIGGTVIEKPNPNPPRRYVFSDGTYVTVSRDVDQKTGRYGDFNVVDPGTALKATASEPEWEPIGSTTGPNILERSRVTGQLRATPNPAVGEKRDTQIVTLSDGSKVLMDMQTGEVIKQLSGPSGPSLAEQQAAIQQQRGALWQKVARGEIPLNQAISDFNEWLAVQNLALDTMKYRVGPKFGEQFSAALKTLSGGGGPVNFTPEAFTFEMPSLDQLAQWNTINTLKGISPLASQLAGEAVPQYPEPSQVGQVIPAYGGPQQAPPVTETGALPPYKPPVAVPGTMHGGFVP